MVETLALPQSPHPQGSRFPSPGVPHAGAFPFWMIGTWLWCRNRSRIAVAFIGSVDIMPHSAMLRFDVVSMAPVSKRRLNSRRNGWPSGTCGMSVCHQGAAMLLLIGVDALRRIVRIRQPCRV